MKRLSVLLASAFLFSCIGIAGAAEPKEKSAKATATKEAKAKTPKKVPAKGADRPAGTVKQSATQDNVGERK
jgi:hypothetical protein